MHILMITGHDIWGTATEFSPLKKILLALGARGHRVELLTYDKVNDGPTALYGQPIRSLCAGVEFRRFRIPGDACLLPWMQRVPVLRSIWNRIRIELLLPALALWKGYRLSRRRRPDLLYGYEVFGTLPAWVLSKILGVPLVLRYQGTLLSLMLYRAKTSLRGKWEVARHFFHVVALRVPADLIVMTNDGTAGRATLRMLGNRSPVRFWRNGVDLGRDGGDLACREEPRRELGLPPGGRILLSATRLSGWKRLDRIVNALPQMAREIPEFLYVIVGDGEMRRELEARVRHLGVEEHVRFVGHVQHDVVLKYMRACDCFICMNDLSNAGNPTMEAMMCARPVVAYDVGETRELIRDRANGRLLRSDAPETVAQAVIELMNDRNLGYRYGRRAQEMAQAQLWTWRERLDAEMAELERLHGAGEAPARQVVCTGK